MLRRGPQEISRGVFLVAGGGLTDPADCLCYLVAAGDRSVLIDTGAGDSIGRIVKNVQAAGVAPSSVTHIVLTHGHADHVGGATEARDKLAAQLVAHAGDARAIETGDPRRTGAAWYGMSLPALTLDVTVEGEAYDLPLSEAGDEILRLIHTPGHTPGSMCAVLDRDGRRVLFGQDIHGPFSADFDSDVAAWAQSMARLLELEADVLAEGHFGVFEGADQVAAFINQHLRAQGFAGR
ncbi:MAG: MBL fold metallo-hydrolase [Proteobacteria bacterium]|nr:MBL fold metallo-hydrolase [Pseudomonadota bacterium]